MNIVWKRPDGSIAITHFDEALGHTAEEHEAFVRDRDPSMVDCVVVANNVSVPGDRAFRDAWVWGPKFIEVSMPKARDIHRGRLRAMRAPLFAGLDVESLRAMESGDRAAQQLVAEQKQALRDAPSDPAIEAAQTPEALKLAVPAALKE